VVVVEEDVAVAAEAAVVDVAVAAEATLQTEETAEMIVEMLLKMAVVVDHQNHQEPDMNHHPEGEILHRPEGENLHRPEGENLRHPEGENLHHPERGNLHHLEGENLHHPVIMDVMCRRQWSVVVGSQQAVETTPLIQEAVPPVPRPDTNPRRRGLKVHHLVTLHHADVVIQDHPLLNLDHLHLNLEIERGNMTEKGLDTDFNVNMGALFIWSYLESIHYLLKIGT